MVTFAHSGTQLEQTHKITHSIFHTHAISREYISYQILVMLQLSH